MVLHVCLQYVANDPKGPRAMAARIRSLEERCNSMEAEAVEKRVKTLEASLSLAQGQLEKMRYQYGGRLYTMSIFFFFVMTNRILISYYIPYCTIYNEHGT